MLELSWEHHLKTSPARAGLFDLEAQMEERNRFDMSVREMAEILAVEESTFHRYRTGFVYGVADRLGWY